MTNGLPHDDFPTPAHPRERRVISLIERDRRAIGSFPGLSARVSEASLATMARERAVRGLIAEDASNTIAPPMLAERSFEASVEHLPRRHVHSQPRDRAVVYSMPGVSWRGVAGLAAMIVVALVVGTVVMKRPVERTTPVLISVQQISDEVQATSAADFSVADASHMLDMQDVSVSEIEEELEFFEQAIAMYR